MRLIDADALMNYARNQILKCVECNDIARFPTINISFGRWLESKCRDECFWVCSNCGFPSEALAANRLYNYCPNCGAKMEKGEEE